MFKEGDVVTFRPAGRYDEALVIDRSSYVDECVKRHGVSYRLLSIGERWHHGPHRIICLAAIDGSESLLRELAGYGLGTDSIQLFEPQKSKYPTNGVTRVAKSSSR